jgi:NAD(P)-dependent dehydrogenase (short-subunit alcohol dehydrogenase family)
MTIRLAGKVAIVTGAGGGGSGRAVARRMARDGAAVVACDVNEAGGRETVRLVVSAGGRAAFLRSDVGIEAEVRALFDFAERTYGGVDVLVNNASAPYPPQGQLTGWFPAIQVDLLGSMFCTLAAVDAMRRRGGGAIVNIGSTSAIGHGTKHSKSPAYDVAKAGVMRLTTALAPLAEREKIRVNCLVPDWVASPEVQEYWDSLTPDERHEQNVPPVLTTLEEVADAVVMLATDEELAGRILVWWNGKPRQFISSGDPGYAALELARGSYKPDGP